MRKLKFAITHAVAVVIGFGAGVYVLPILTEEAGASEAELIATAATARHIGEFRRDLKGSDPLHWAEGELIVTRSSIAFRGSVAPGPDYKIYLVPKFVETKEAFIAIKDDARRVANLKTFGDFVLPLGDSIDPDAFNTVVIWCERFAQFISAAQYR